MDVDKHLPGSFCTAVLRTTDIQRAAEFYAALVGWTIKEVPNVRGHCLLQLRGKTVAGIQEIREGVDVWVPHAAVENIERTAEDAVALGGTVVDRLNIPGMARLATLNDKEGAVFGLWEPAPCQGVEIVEEPGSLWWIEVLSNDVEGARNFYQSLFGWNSTDTSFEPFSRYTVFKRGDVQEGGILPIGPDWGVSPRWNSIFAVDACNPAIEKAKTLGGSCVFVHTVPKAGRIGLVKDPGGALFVIRGPVPAQDSN
jgi:predicted enzyme related to lactoylglutathione lyase